MRITLNIDDDALEILKEYAKNRSVGLGKAGSEIMRRARAAPLRTRLVNGFHAVVLPPGFSKITSEGVKRLLEGEL